MTTTAEEMTTTTEEMITTTEEMTNFKSPQNSYPFLNNEMWT